MQNIQKNESLWNAIASTGVSVIKKAKFGSAMDTILVLVALVTVPSLIIFVFVRWWPLLIISFSPVLYFFRVYDYLMKHNSKLLRTEKHEETMLQIAASMMGQKNKEVAEAVIDALPAVTATDNPSTAKPKLITIKPKKEHE